MMDNLQVWIYIALGIVYLIGRSRKKAPQPPGRQNQPQQEPIGPKPLTFEELLKEITEAKEPLPPVLKPVQEFEDYDDEIEEEKEPARPEYDYRKQETYQSYEQSKFEAFNHLSYEETMKLEDTNVEFGKFKVFEEEKAPPMAEQIAADFADIDRVKRAFIMGEIFNRRYA
jgi:hypothetical protein